MKSKNTFFVFLLCITFEEIVLIYMTEAVIVRKVSSFKEMKLVPDEAYRIDDIKQVFSVSACLLECSRKADCQSVIHEGSKCSLYNTTLVTGQKKPEQNVLAMNKTAMINHLEICAKMKPCDRNKVCELIAISPYFSCPPCVPWCFGDRCKHCYQIPGLIAPKTTVSFSNGTVLEVPAANGWIVLLRRQDGSVKFTDKLWNDYKKGFGDFQTEFWLGNDWIHLLTTNCSYRVRFDLVSFRGRWAYAEYSNFRIGPESDNYRLHISGYYGNATDDLMESNTYYDVNNMSFSTRDNDNDRHLVGNCAGHSGWWYNHCGRVRLTGDYGSSWDDFDNNLAYADMKIKRN